MSSITVVIPTYNVGQYIAEAINSALSQTRIPDEIIIVDDCSTDNTRQVAESFAHLGVRVISTRCNRGSAEARNMGILHANSEYIALLDGDDYWLPNHLKVVEDLLDSSPTAALSYTMTQAFGDASWTWKSSHTEGIAEDHLSTVLNYEFPPQINVLARKSALLDVGGYDPQYFVAQDFDLWLRMAYRYHFVCSHAVTSCYRKHAASTGTVNRMRYEFSTYKASYNFLDRLKQAGDEALYKACKDVVLERFKRSVRCAYHANDVHDTLHLANMGVLVPGSESFVRHMRIRQKFIPVRKLITGAQSAASGMKAYLNRDTKDLTTK